MKKTILLLLAVFAVGFSSLRAADAPKKLLVVTTTTGFRHSSIATAERILTQLGTDSGAYTVDLLEQPAGKPADPKKPADLPDNPSDADKDKYAAEMTKYQAAVTAYQEWEARLRLALMKLSPESLQQYDGVVFASTTGDLPIPDREGFLNWIKAGHAFIAIHAGSDTFHGWPGYIDMLGGEFAHHGKQVGVVCINQDPKHPANAHLGDTFTVSQEEIYQFKNYDPTKVHDLLTLDKHPETGEPGHYAVSWCKFYGKGRVFYTSLGHREDVWDADPNMKDRKNSPEISKAYQQHVLGGIKWALALEEDPLFAQPAQ